MQIRRAEKGDIPRVVELWMEMTVLHTKLDERFQINPLAQKVMKGRFEDELHDPRSIILVAEDNGLVIGYLHGIIVENPPVIFDQMYGLISDLAVTESHRRKGVGSELLKAAHQWFKENNLRYVETSVAIRNEMSRRFWREHGYKEFMERLRLNDLK